MKPREPLLTAATTTMAVAAGQLNVRLEKPGHYVLQYEARRPCPSDVAAARQLVCRGVLVSACLALGLRKARRA